MAETNPNVNALAQINADNRGLVLTNLADMRTAAQIIFQSKLAPEALKTPEQIFVCLQLGAEIGLRPMQALNNVYVVRGRPVIWGDVALGLVKRSGLLDIFTEKIEGEGDAMVATVQSLRKGDDREVTSTFSVSDAKLAGLWKKSGPWTTHPKRMLKYKARAFNLRDNFPDVLMGMHLAEEMEGEELPPPVCDTPSRDDRRKPVDSKTINTQGPPEARQGTQATEARESPEHVGNDVKPAEAQGTEATAPPAGEASVQQLYESLLVEFATKAGLTGKEALAKFNSFASFVLLLEEDEINSADKFTREMLLHLKHELDNGIPKEI